MQNDDEGFLQVISIFSVDKASGHSVYDDQFYFDILKKSGRHFEFYAPAYSTERLARHKGSGGSELFSIRVEDRGLVSTIKAITSIPVRKNARIVFLGYSERFVFLFRLLKFFARYELVLVATNNFSVRRINKYKHQLKLFFFVIGNRLKRLVVHTEKEKQMCAAVVKSLTSRTVVKKHHLMIPRERASKESPRVRNVVLFLGPEKYDKPAKPMIELIKADSDKLFDYEFLNVDARSVRERLETREADNVRYINRWLSKQEYFDLFSGASLIMMPHDASFEGKLSGNLCDCVALGVPFISSGIEPVEWFMGAFGPIGYVCDFADPDWAARFLEKFEPESYEERLRNLSRAAKSYAREQVEADNLRAIFD